MNKNSLYPLPDDYHQLTLAGKREARIAAISRQDTPEDLVWAWHTFRQLYLMPLPEGVWYAPKVDSPEFHYNHVKDIGEFDRIAKAWPRASGKTKLLLEVILLFALTRPYYKILCLKSHTNFVEIDTQDLKQQLEDNPYIINDFGKLKPPRGKGKWKDGALFLTNGFRYYCVPVVGKILGFRANWMIFDDTEFDPKMRVNPTVLTEHTKRLYRSHAIPILERKLGSVLFQGTINRRDSFLYYLCTTPVADDPSLSVFRREVLGARNEGKLLWPQKWDEETLIRMEEEMTPAEFSTMMMNEPASPEDRTLHLHPRYGYYELENEDAESVNDPLNSEANLISWKESKTDPIQVCRPFGKTVSNMYRVLVADPIRNPSASSDWATVMVIGFERSDVYKDTWWVLDLRVGKVEELTYIHWIWELGFRWRCRLVAVEAYGTQVQLAAQVKAEYELRNDTMGWVPKVLPLKYTGDMKKDKASRIQGLAWRMERNRIKVPKQRIHKHPFSELVHQIEHFTPNLVLLENDDVIDTLAMAQFVNRPGGKYGEKDERKEDIQELLARGQRFFPGTRIPILSSINASELTPKAIQGIERVYPVVKNRFRRVRRILGGHV